MTASRPRGLVVLGDRWEYDSRVVFGEGNNARTFVGRDLETGAGVFIKVFDHAAGESGHERFLREVEMHEGLRHEAILELLGRGPDGDVDYIVTPQLQPGSLWRVVKDPDTRRSPAATLAIGTRIAGALAYMHGRKEVHGDVSPGNVLLDGEGNAYLADFGFSKRLATIPAVTTGDGFRTEGYNLPREDDAPRTYEDDVYGLAAVLWFCLTGDSPAELPGERRRQIPSKSLRAPLVEALDWERGTIPSAADFAERLPSRWGSSAEDWRQVVSAPPPRSRIPEIAVVALIALVCAWFGGRALQAKPADAQAITGGGVSLHLDGEWRRSKEADGAAVLGISAPVAAEGNGKKVVAGRAQSSGPGMLSAAARASLPRGARKPEPVAVGGRTALRYGPARTGLGVVVEVLVFPLEDQVLVLRCTAFTGAPARACARAADGLELSEGSVQPLAPTTGVMRRLRAATSKLSEERQGKRKLLASATDQSKLSGPARQLARANRSFATAVAALPGNAQDATVLEAAEKAAGEAAGAYVDLAKADTEPAWRAARKRVDQSERRLEVAIGDLAKLRAYRQ